MCISHGAPDSTDTGPSHNPSQKSRPGTEYSLIPHFCASTVGHLIRPVVISGPRWVKGKVF